MRLLSYLVVILVALAAGCSRQPALSVNQAVTLPNGEVKSFGIEPAKEEREVRVEVKTTGAAVSVYVVQEKDRAAAMDALTAGKHPANLLTARENEQQSNVVTRVPAGEGFAVIVANQSGNAAVLTLQITGK